MWGSLLKAVAHVAVSHAVKQRQAERLGGAAPVAVAAPGKRPRPGFPVLAVLLGVVGFCCLSTGLLSELGSTTRLLDSQIEHERSQAFASMITGFALCIFPALLMLGLAIGSYGRNHFETRLVALIGAHPSMPIDDMAKSLGTTPERVRAVWREAVEKNYVDGRGDLFASPPASAAPTPRAPTTGPAASAPRPAPVAPLAASSPSPDAPAVAPLAKGTQRWTGICPSCRAAVEVLLFPGMRPRCPACRASLGFQA